MEFRRLFAILVLSEGVAALSNPSQRAECGVDCSQFSPWSWPTCLIRGIQTFDMKLHPCRLIVAKCNEESIYAGKCKKEGHGNNIIISVESDFGICSSDF